MSKGNKIGNAEIILHCRDIDEDLAFFTERLQFRLDSIFPADNPRIAVISGHGLRIRLEKSNVVDPVNISIAIKCDSPESFAEGKLAITAPNGTQIKIEVLNPELKMPDLTPSIVVNRLSDGSEWITGRAGMRYRDLIPDRQGGRFIASHIHIPDAGPVPDYVHYHKVRFQMIYCYKGWVKVVYEDQGEPFVLNAGDCVLQPPEIRHRVLESSADLEVIEVSSPAEHETFAEHEMELPNKTVNPGRDFSGQRFTRHIAAEADWEPWRIEGFKCRDTGIGDATNGLAGVRVARRISNGIETSVRHDAEFVFIFVLAGVTGIELPNRSLQLCDGDSFVIPSGVEYCFSACSDDLQFLEVSLPEFVSQL